MAGRLGGLRGGILTLLDLIEKHRAAFDYEWRTRFGLELVGSLPDVVPWAEALRLTRILGQDPTSWLCASINGWDSPASIEFGALADLFDLQGKRTPWKRGSKPKPYPRPWDPKPKKRGQAVSIAEWERRKALRNKKPEGS